MHNLICKINQFIPVKFYLGFLGSCIFMFWLFPSLLHDLGFSNKELEIMDKLNTYITLPIFSLIFTVVNVIVFVKYKVQKGECKNGESKYRKARS